MIELVLTLPVVVHWITGPALSPGSTVELTNPVVGGTSEPALWV